MTRSQVFIRYPINPHYEALRALCLTREGLGLDQGLTKAQHLRAKTSPFEDVLFSPVRKMRLT